MKKKKLLSLLLVVMMLLNIAPFAAWAEDDVTPAADATVYVTVSNQGILAQANDDSIMLNREVTVTDLDKNGKLTVDEALVAAHEAYNKADGYAKTTSAYGTSVTKLWGSDTYNTLFFVNNAGIPSGVAVDTVENGDYLTASINKDNIYYADWYTFFDKRETAVEAGEDLTLTLKGHLGMAYTDEDKADVALSDINVGLWQDGAFQALDSKTTDNNGKVTLSFDEEGTYYVTASGTVEDDVTVDWSTGATAKADCPIIAPGCVVTVTKKSEEPGMSDEDALAKVYGEFSDKNKGYNSSTKTPLVFPLEYNGVTYTNVLDYLKAWTLQETGRKLDIAFDYVNGATGYTDWRDGNANKVTFNAFDKNGEISQDYFKDNQPATQRLSNVYFTIGKKTSAKIASIYVKASSLERTNEEMVAFMAANLPFARITGKNVDQDHVVQPVGALQSNGTLGALPTMSTDDLYTKKNVNIAWSLANKSGKSDALTLDKNNKTTITRPNVGEENAVFTLTATVSAVADPTVKQEVNYDLTVPAFDEVTVPVKVTKGAKLELTDNYYKQAVADKYIVQAESGDENYDLYNCALHTNATGGNQTFAYSVSKAGYITKTGTITVTSGTNEPVVIDLAASSAADTKLGSLEILAPQVKNFDFSADKTDYEIEVSGANSVKIAGTAAVEGAKVQITSYYKTLANANKGTLTTTGTNLSARGMTCYLPDKVSTSKIEITVTAPKGSTQEVTTQKYTITVKKTAESMPLTNLTVTVSSTAKGALNKQTAAELAKEETLTPTFVAGGKEEAYYYTVNYFRDQITVKPTAAGSTIKVNEQTVQSGKASANIPLQVGDNTITVSVTKAGVTTDYKLIVHRKAELRLTDVTLDNGALANLAADWTCSCNFAHSVDKLNVTFNTNLEDQSKVKVRVALGDETYEGAAGEAIEIPVGDKAKIIPIVYLIYDNGGVMEGQGYVISFNRMASDAPAAVETYLPAPGQFVNTEAYQNADKTLSNSAVVTLGSFGGSIVYKYNEPLKNDPKNPYGIDFIVYGNCFTNTDGTTASVAAEPAAVMVSKDGNTWYELAGSEYYTASAKHDYKVTYVNGDTSFKAAADVAWQDNDGVKGVLSVNEYHKQPYYPNPDFYVKYNQGAGANTTYNATSASFTGTLIDAGFYPFGYADSHSAAEPKSNQAVNPYLKNHQLIYNGDGFDLSWAVDSEGKPVQLDEVSYIKIYNPTLAIRGEMGESSPEIATMLRAQVAEAAVGVSNGLTALNVNGQDVALQNGVYSYNLDANKASTLNITPTANSAANIYVSNQRVSAGDTAAISAVEKVRIIVQEGEKEPVIYLLNFTNIKGANSNADLTALALTPGDESQSPSEENKFSFSVASGVSAVRFTPTLANKNASAVLKTADKEIPLTHGEPSEAVSLKTGDNTFTLTVTSADKTASKVYTIIVNRAQSGGTATDPKTINVRFSLTGDVLHGDGGGHKNPTWISQRSVTVPTNSTVKYLTEMMLNNAGIDYVTNGIYVSEINGLAEKDNGPYSGWMYRQNGVIADEGYAARKLSDGDVIKWFYTDDYTKETGYEGNWDKVNSGSAAAAGKYIVKFETNGGSSVKNQSIAKDGIVTKPSDPTKTGFTFQGWYTDKGLTKKYDFGTKVTADLTLYAKWEAKKDDPKDDQDYLAAFTDVDKSAWYAEAVKYAVKNNLLKGISATEFAPEAEMSRAMFVTVLYRLEGEQKAALVNPFSDVAKDAWYKDAVIWAYSKGIVAGVSEDTFAPNHSVTREQMAAILYQYARYKGCDMSKTADLSQYSDSDEVSAWALTAVKWANGASVVNGVSENALSPKTTATRAQAAAMFMRFCENIAK